VSSNLRAGDWVEVRSKEEILSSLDKNGRLQELPFMPQMFRYCGQRFRVFKRAHKTCDTVNPVASRRVADAVHLDLRCDGAAYGGCQAACLIFWKEAWLKPISGGTSPAPPSEREIRDRPIAPRDCTERDVWNATRRHGESSEDIRYVCQATHLPFYTEPLQWWDPRQYLEDYSSGNITLGRLLSGALYVLYYHLTLAKRNRLGRPGRWLYDQFQFLIGGVPFPWKKGTVPAGHPTPRCDLNLQPGDLVRVKSHEAILATLDSMKNRGMHFDAELVPYCGKIFRVRTRVEKFINEKTGQLSTLKTPAVILEGVWCQSRYSQCRMFCPRAIYSWWREIWLERVEAPAEGPERRVKTASATNARPLARSLSDAEHTP
jgi:hypothetical protein